MFAGDFSERNAKIAVLPAANDGHIARDGKAAPLPVRPEHDEYRLHTVNLSVGDDWDSPVARVDVWHAGAGHVA